MLYIFMPFLLSPNFRPNQSDQRYDNLTANKVNQGQHPRVFGCFRWGIFRSELRLSTLDRTGRQQT